MWDLWSTKRYRGRFSPSTSVSLASHSTNRSTFIIHHPRLVQLASSGLSNSELRPTPPQKWGKPLSRAEVSALCKDKEETMQHPGTYR
jgi:hypothetical protein